MSISLLSSTIDRSKLASVTNDTETIKYFENLQRDLSGAVSTGIDDSQEAAEAAQTAASAAQLSASNAQIAATAAQSTANGAQATATAAQASADSAQSDATTANNLANAINTDYVSKSALISQSVGGNFQATSFYVVGNKVVGARQTGWTVGTGTSYLGAFAADTTYAAGATYLQADAAVAYADLRQAKQRILALEKAMRTHGLIN